MNPHCIWNYVTHCQSFVLNIPMVDLLYFYDFLPSRLLALENESQVFVILVLSTPGKILGHTLDTLQMTSGRFDPNFNTKNFILPCA